MSLEKIEKKVNDTIRKDIETGNVSTWGLNEERPGHITGDEMVFNAIAGSSIMEKIKDALEGTEVEKYIDLNSGIEIDEGLARSYEFSLLK
jgi:hypothetical protein